MLRSIIIYFILSFWEELKSCLKYPPLILIFSFGFRYKRSKLEVQMNRDVIWCVLVLISLCLIGAVGNTTWLSSYNEYIPFLNTLTFEETQPFYDGFLVFWTFVITLQVIIPMSLYVTLEMTKLLQIYLIQQGIFLQFFIY